MPIQTRHPIAMAQQALANQEVCEGRFVLGLGPSHHWIVTDMLGLPYERPAAFVRRRTPLKSCPRATVS
jgi:alkanesulfonate monooxygenase SsuD/methylene tetrahydromethanopterin reductase-like flavin-dependent oxidoreductase (luciferase family)